MIIVGPRPQPFPVAVSDPVAVPVPGTAAVSGGGSGLGAASRAPRELQQLPHTSQLQPGTGAEWTEVAGVYAMVDGPDSPITQTFGLGLFDPLAESQFDAIEAFFRDRGALVSHEVSPLIPPDVLALLNQRRYQPI